MICRPMLAHLYAPKRFTTPAFVQPKLDGVRALYVGGRFYSRDGIEWHPSVVRHLTAQLQHLPMDHVPLDGEFYVHGWPLQKINSAIAVKRVAPSKETDQVQFHVFDSISSRPFNERWIDGVWEAVNTKMFPLVQIVDAKPIYGPSDVEDYFIRHRELGYEGTMVRLGSGGYTSPGHGADQDNRTWTLLKRKGWLDGWFEVVGAIEGEGKHAGRMGALRLMGTNGRIFEVGTGFSDAERARYWKQYEIDSLPLSVKIQYRYLSADGIPCHTSFIESDD